MPTHGSRDEERVSRYTSKKRKRFREQVTERVPLTTRLRGRMDSVWRSVFYAFFRLLLRNRPLTKPIELSLIDRVLIIPYGDAIGDMVAALPVVEAIARRSPSVSIGIIASPRNRSLVDNDPRIAKVYDYSGRSDWANLSELRRARRDGYQLVLNFHFTKLTDYGLISNYIAPKGIKVTAHHPRVDRYKLLFNYIGGRHRHTTHLIHHCLELLAEVAVMEPPLMMYEIRPSIHVLPSARAHVNAAIDAALERSGKTRFVLLNTQARHPFREWGEERNGEFIDACLGQLPDHAILLTAGSTQQALNLKLVERANRKEVIAFETGTDLTELAVLLDRSDILITPDTATVQYAVAANRPVIVLFDRPPVVEWLPIQVPSRLFSPSVAGAPVSTIPVEPVVLAMEEILRSSWLASQTYSERAGEQHANYQAASQMLPLSTFNGSVI